MCPNHGHSEHSTTTRRTTTHHGHTLPCDGATALVSSRAAPSPCDAPRCRRRSSVSPPGALGLSAAVRPVTFVARRAAASLGRLRCAPAPQFAFPERRRSSSRERPRPHEPYALSRSSSVAPAALPPSPAICTPWATEAVDCGRETMAAGPQRTRDAPRRLDASAPNARNLAGGRGGTTLASAIVSDTPPSRGRRQRTTPTTFP